MVSEPTPDAVLDVLDELAETFRDTGHWSAYHHVRAVAHRRDLHLTRCVGGKRRDSAEQSPEDGSDPLTPTRLAWSAAHARYPDTAFGGEPAALALSRVAFVEGYAAAHPDQS